MQLAADAVEVQQAAHVGGGDVVGAGRGEIAQAIPAHAARHFGKLDRERAAEPAALVARRVHEREIRDVAQQSLRRTGLARRHDVFARRAEAELAQKYEAEFTKQFERLNIMKPTESPRLRRLLTIAWELRKAE